MWHSVELTIVVYFDQRSGAAPLNTGWNQWKTMQNAGISLKFSGFYLNLKEKKGKTCF